MALPVHVKRHHPVTIQVVPPSHDPSGPTQQAVGRPGLGGGGGGGGGHVNVNADLPNAEGCHTHGFIVLQ